MGNYITPIPPVISEPERRDKIVTSVQTALSTYTTWIASFGTAYRLTNTDEKGVDVPDVFESPTSYHRPTPNVNIPGQSFIILGEDSYGGEEEWSPNGVNYFTFLLEVIISFNLEKIDKPKYQGYYFPELLKKEVIEILSKKLRFQREIVNVTDIPEDVWSGFDFEINKWHKAPLGAFKISMNVTARDECGTNDYTNALESLNASERQTVIQSMTAVQIQSAMTAQQITDLSALICP